MPKPTTKGGILDCTMKCALARHVISPREQFQPRFRCHRRWVRKEGTALYSGVEHDKSSARTCLSFARPRPSALIYPHYSNLQAAIQKACLEPSFHVNVRSWLHKHQSLGTIDVKPDVFHIVEARRTCLVTLHWQGWTAVSMYWSSEAGVKLWNLRERVCVLRLLFFLQLQ